MAFKTTVVLLLPLPLPLPSRLAWEFQCVEWKKFASVQWCTHHERKCCFISLFHDFMIVRMLLTEISDFRMTCSPILMVMVVKNCVPYASIIFHVSEHLTHRSVVARSVGILNVCVQRSDFWTRMSSNALWIVRSSVSTRIQTVLHSKISYFTRWQFCVQYREKVEKVWALSLPRCLNSEDLDRLFPNFLKLHKFQTESERPSHFQIQSTLGKSYSHKR